MTMPTEKNFTETELPQRNDWVTPEVRRMRAGDAEAGANPIRPEGIFAQGS